MKINQLRMGAMLSYVSMGIGYIISIVYTPIMLRVLGQSEYGLYNLVISVVSYLGLLSFGFGSAYMRYYSRYKINKEDKNIAKLNGMFLIVFSIIAVIAIIVGTIFVLNINLIFGDKLTSDELAKAKILMIIMIFNMAFTLQASIFTSYITANERYIFQKSLQVLKTVINPFVMLPVLLMGYKSIGMMVVTTLITVVVETSNIIFCLKKLKMKFLFMKFDFKLMKEISVFSSYIFLNMIIDQINWNVDKFIVGRYTGTIGVAIYGLGAQLNTYYLSLSTAISNVFIPRINKMVAKGESDKELTSLFTRVGRIQFILLSFICSGFIFLGEPFIRLWAGEDYADAYKITLLLIIPVTIPLIQNIGIEIQRAKNMHKFRSWVYFFIALANIGLSIPLTKYYGGIGAALGTAVSLLIGNFLAMNLYYHYKIKLDMKYFWKQILKFLPALVIPAMVGGLIKLYVNTITLINFVIFGAIYSVVFLASMWVVGINKYEKQLIITPLKKIFNISCESMR